VFILYKFSCVYVNFFYGTWCLCCCFYVLGLNSCVVIGEFFFKFGYGVTIGVNSLLCDCMLHDNDGGMHQHRSTWLGKQPKSDWD